MAQEYEDEHSKDEILEEYLNTATYGTTDGRSAVGVEAASEVFFDKSVKDLGLKEQALLAGLPQAPTDYNPFINPEGAIERRNQVLDAMAGQGYITEEKADEVKDRASGLQRGYRFEQREQQYFFDFVQDELIERYGLQDRPPGRPQGLHDARSRPPGRRRARRSPPTRSTGAANALVSTDTDTGEILAMASSSTYDTSQFNLAADGDPPARLVVQALRPDHRGRPGHRPRHDLLPGAQLDHASSPTRLGARGTVSGGGSGSMTLRAATAQLGQHRLRPARARRRPRELRRHGEEARHHLPARRLLRRGARRHDHLLHGARDVQRLRDPRQRRRPPRPDRDQQGRLPRTATSTSPRTPRATA